MPKLVLSFDAGEESLSVRRFLVEESISRLFTVSVWALSDNPSIDLDAIVGHPASLEIDSGYAHSRSSTRRWTGICSQLEQIQAESTGLSAYHVRIVPAMYRLTQRRNHRIFQHLSIPDIVAKVLAEWGIKATWKIARESYPKLEYKVQYGESDFDLVSRLLEEAGIAFTFGGDDGGELRLGDALEGADARSGPPIHVVDNPSQSSELEFVTKVRISNEVRPGAHVIRDYDFRNPNFNLLAESPKAASPEDRLEQFHYQPGSFLVEGGRGGDTPVADDKGVARHEQASGKARAERALQGARQGKTLIGFDTNAVDLTPGVVLTFLNHPHPQIGPSRRLLISSFSLDGSSGGEWTLSGSAVFADVPYRPMLTTKKPSLYSVQSATVVGPPGEEIHTDEFGRIRVQFPWDREGKGDDNSSCWIRVSQGWAGAGYGMMLIPRVGQEVLVGFLEGDPDQPVVVGRGFNNRQRVPYDLPKHKTRSTWKSDSSPGSNGFNEILFEDLKSRELIYMQAEKNLRKLVKNDETITVGNNRQKLVKNNETETTGVNRTEVTGSNRTELTYGNRTTVIGKNERRLVKGSETEQTLGSRFTFIGKDQDLVVMRVKREMVGQDSHLRVKGEDRRRFDASQSIIVGQDQDERVGQKHALHAGKEIHLASGGKVVIEAGQDLTFKSPGGFVRIDGGGITIRGTMVKINSGGSPGAGSGCSPVEPEDAIEAVVEEPAAPPTDDVSKTGLAQ